MAFEALEVQDPRWANTVAASGAGIFYSQDYCRFRLQGAADRPLMLRYEDDLGVVFDVTVAKRIAALPFFERVAKEFRGEPPIDLASPEYNGPVVMSQAGSESELICRYRRAVNKFCSEQSVVTEFVRAHPMLGALPALATQVDLTPASEMVYVDLRQGYEAARKNYSSKRRQELNRAARNGARMEIVTACEQAITRFALLYAEAMQRKAAKSVRIFSGEYFLALFRHLADKALLVEAFDGDAIASSTIFLLDGKNVWALYEGTVAEALDSDANLFKTDRMIEWSAQNGYEYFLLGGGERPGDGMYTYKMRYSKLTSPVRHMKHVHNQKALELLQAAKGDYDRSTDRATRYDYFPSYWLT